MYFPGAEKSEKLTPAWKNSPIRTGKDRPAVSLVKDVASPISSTGRSIPRSRLREEELKNIINEASAMFDDDEDHISESLIQLSGSNEINDDLTSSTFKSEVQNGESIGTLHSNSIFSGYYMNNDSKKTSSNVPLLRSEYQDVDHSSKALNDFQSNSTKLRSPTSFENTPSVVNTEVASETVEKHLQFLDKIDEDVRSILGSIRTEKIKSLTVPVREIYNSYRSLSIEELRNCVADKVLDLRIMNY